MGTLLRTLALGIAFAATVSGCGQGNDDTDIDTLPVVTEDDKADTTGSPLIWVRPSSFPIYCIGYPCATKQVAEVNGGEGRLIFKYDWRALKLTATEQTTAEANHFNMLLRGRYNTVKVSGQPMTVLQISRASVKVSSSSDDNAEKDSFYLTKEAPCSKQPCPAVQAEMINKTAAPEVWATVDLSRLGLSTTQQQSLLTEMQDKTGQVYVSQATTPTGSKQISQAFRSIKSPALK
ncbi:MAG TPA: hypothetical protein PKL17_04230 [Pseudomonadota bacterium]|jgi:hypothetical protein|nr:hypothetical protein [Pseudomonadota bacterium]HND11493.1 hypothetical protein [Pseudomonadota bacterium]HNK43966.1 hypothetical protein [Pseudomonadota bacterium]HNN50373.1 hypothetical protein [Pseudomonadota bacterium]